MYLLADLVNDLSSLLTRIDDVLKKAGEENVRRALNPNVDDMFVKVEADIEAFLTRHSAPQCVISASMKSS